MSKETSQVGRGRPRKYPYPAKLVCTVTGKVVLTNPTQMKSQLEKSGKTLEEYIKTYVCRSERKQMKTGKRVKHSLIEE